jgi:hypothetical protein
MLQDITKSIKNIENIVFLEKVTIPISFTSILLFLTEILLSGKTKTKLNLNGPPTFNRPCQGGPRSC